MKKFLIIVFALFIVNGSAQDGLILDKIISLQAKNDSFYNDGLFRSKIVARRGKKTVDDNNIFNTALVFYTLQSIKKSFSVINQIRIDSICSKTDDLLQYYKNRNGGITYNFYQVRPENPFPQLKRLSKMKKMRLADDLDVTSLVYLIQQSSDSLNMAVKEKMVAQSGQEKKIASTYKQYRYSKAYPTWFAKKMKQDFDICVMANVLTFVFEKELPLEIIDMQTIDLISKMVIDNTHLHNEYMISAHYQNSSIILYHLARLISIANHPELNKLREQIISDIHNELPKVTNSMEKVILLTALFRLGKKADFELDIDTIANDMNTFYWYKANPFYGSRLFMKKLVGDSNFLHIEYKCEAYYWSLVLELQHFSSGKIVTKNDNRMILFR